MLRGIPAVTLLGAIAVGLLGAPRPAEAKSRMLERAKSAYENLDYGKVIPLVSKALRSSLTPEEEIQAYFLLGTVHTIYSRDRQAQEAFAELLKRAPQFEVPADTSPKIREAVDQARAATAAGPPPEPPPGTSSPPESSPPPVELAPPTQATIAPPVDPLALMTGADAMQPTVNHRSRGGPFYETWWFWTAIGVVAAGGGGVLGYYLLQPRYPEHDYGPIPLR